MALHSSSVHHAVPPVNDPAAISGNAAAASILGALMLAFFTAQQSKRAMRKFRKQAVIALFKYKVKAAFSKVKSLFSKDIIDGISDTTLLYILLSLLVLILIFTLPPLVAIVVLLIGILLILLTRKKA